MRFAGRFRRASLTFVVTVVRIHPPSCARFGGADVVERPIYPLATMQRFIQRLGTLTNHARAEPTIILATNLIFADIGTISVVKNSGRPTVRSSTQQTGTAQVDLIIQSQTFVPFAALNLIHAGRRFNRPQDAVLQPQVTRYSTASWTLSRMKRETLSAVSFQESLRARTPQKMQCEPWSRRASPHTPRHLLRPTLRTVCTTTRRMQ